MIKKPVYVTSKVLINFKWILTSTILAPYKNDIVTCRIACIFNVDFGALRFFWLTLTMVVTIIETGSNMEYSTYQRYRAAHRVWHRTRAIKS